MRPPFPLLLLALLLTACDATDEGPAVVGGVYQSVAGGDPATGSTVIDLDIPETRSGAFVLGDRSAFEATAASSSDRVALSGTGEVVGSSVTVDGAAIVFGSGPGEARYERQ